MNDLRLSTDRLELMAATIEMLRADLVDRARLGALLEADVPDAWPPELLDEGPIRYTIDKLGLGDDQHGWWVWYVVLPEGARRTLIGVVGYKGPPASGHVEIGYGVLDEYQRRGYATEALAGLIGRAFARADVMQVIGETLPPLTPSIRVLEKSGFVFTGAGSEAGVIRYALSREAWEAQRNA